MTIQKNPFTNWQQIQPQSQYQRNSPNLVLLRDYLIATWGGQNLGIYGAMPKGATYIRTHYNGAALDWRYENPGPGKDFAQAFILRWLIDYSHELGIQSIHDYVNRRIWHAKRTSNEDDAHSAWWKLQKPDGKMGAKWATYFHIETTRQQWNVTVPIDMRLGKPVEQVTFKPTLKLGATGDYVRWLQQRLRNNGYSGMEVSGRYTQNTHDNVVWFQTVSGLSPDGVVGPKTWGAIDTLPTGIPS